MEVVTTKIQNRLIYAVITSIMIMLLFIYTFVLVKYGNTEKYDIDLIITIFLGFSVLFTFIVVGDLIILTFQVFEEQVKDRVVEQLEAEKDAIKRR